MTVNPGDGVFENFDRRLFGKIFTKLPLIKKNRLTGKFRPVINAEDHQKCSSLRAVRTSTPVAVTARVCSHWAERRPSRVSTVQPSLCSLVPDFPALIIGSIVKVKPSTSSIPVPGVP